MEITLVASTNSIKTKQEALLFGRAAARVCYTEKSFSQILDEEDPQGLINATLNSGHHSVYDHVHLTFYIEGIPKIGAMILNNEKPYTTSEKSARYTAMKPEGRQKELYEKWLAKIRADAAKAYPQLSEAKLTKLAQENARYMLSVFTPTKMLYTVSFRQLNRIMHAFKAEKIELVDTPFSLRAKDFMDEFLLSPAVNAFFEEKLDYRNKPRQVSLFSQSSRKLNHFGETYAVTYESSLAYLAQAQRHRTISYSFTPPLFWNDAHFFTPPIVSDRAEWLADIKTAAEHDFPQGTLVRIAEWGHYADFIAKMHERLCENAQWEIMDRTRQLLLQYIEQTEREGVRKELLAYTSRADGKTTPNPACRFPRRKECSGGPFGANLALERLV